MKENINFVWFLINFNSIIFDIFYIFFFKLNKIVINIGNDMRGTMVIWTSCPVLSQPYQTHNSTVYSSVPGLPNTIQNNLSCPVPSRPVPSHLVLSYVRTQHTLGLFNIYNYMAFHISTGHDDIIIFYLYDFFTSKYFFKFLLFW